METHSRALGVSDSGYRILYKGTQTSPIISRQIDEFVRMNRRVRQGNVTGKFVPAECLACWLKSKDLSEKVFLHSTWKGMLSKATYFFTESWRVTKAGFITLFRKETTERGMACKTSPKKKPKTMSSTLRPQKRYFGILVEFLAQEETINATHYLQTLQELSRVQCDRHPVAGRYPATR